MSSVLKTIQQGVADRLLADPYFSNIPVLTENIGDLENQIAIAMMKIGVGVIILTPSANTRSPDSLNPYFDEIKIHARVLENVLFNQSASGTQKPAATIAETLTYLLHGYRPDGINEGISCASPAIALGNDPKFLSYDCRFQTQGGLSYVVPKVATPAISQLGNQITITCATAGAAMFYTTNGTSAAPRVGTLYTAPFSGTTGNKVLVRAWLAGYIGSDVAQQIVL